MNPKQIDQTFSVSPQPAPEDMAQLAEQGFVAVIANRPDDEEPGQPSADEMRRAAEAAGLTFHHIPVTGGQFPDEVISSFGDIRRNTPGKILGYCRTGTRSASLNALANPTGISAEERLNQAREAGYDLSGLRARLGE